MHLFPSEVVSIFFTLYCLYFYLQGCTTARLPVFCFVLFCLNVILVINCASYSH